MVESLYHLAVAFFNDEAGNIELLTLNPTCDEHVIGVGERLTHHQAHHAGDIQTLPAEHIGDLFLYAVLRKRTCLPARDDCQIIM